LKSLAKSTALIGTRATKGKGMCPWLQQTFVGEEDCVMSPKNVCVGGYKNGYPVLDQESQNHDPVGQHIPIYIITQVILAF